jgi:hypothetical protein
MNSGVGIVTGFNMVSFLLVWPITKKLFKRNKLIRRKYRIQLDLSVETKKGQWKKQDTKFTQIDKPDNPANP